MIRRYWLLTAIAALGLARAGAAEEAVLLNADQISFQLSRTKSLSRSARPTTIELPAVTFVGATDRLSGLGKRQLDELARALAAGDDQTRTFAIVPAAAPAGPTGITTRRAAAVRDYLVGRRGVKPARFAVADPMTRPPSMGVALVLNP